MISKTSEGISVRSEGETKIIIAFTQEEAGWLKDLMRNPIGIECHGESERERELRTLFHETLKEAGA